MSQELVRVLPPQMEFAIAPESALAQAFLGGETTDEVDLSEIDLGEHNDLVGIAPEVPLLKADGGAGKFVVPGEDARKAPEDLYGVILARQGSRVAFIPRDRVADYARSNGFNALLDEEAKWFCRCPNIATPQQAQLNPALTEAQRAEALRLRIGGATGNGCVGCPANHWADTPDGKVRICKESESLVWLDSQTTEPVVLQVIASSSVVSLQKYLKTCFTKGKPVPLFLYFVRLSFEAEKSDRPGVKDFYVLQVSRIRQIPKESLKPLADVFRSNLYLLERASKRSDVIDSVGFEQPASVASDVADDVLGGVL